MPHETSKIIIDQVSLTDLEFTRDNATVWSELKSTCLDTSTYEWIRSYNNKKDGRGNLIALINMYEGQQASEKCVLLVNHTILLDHNSG